jgi:hypothetical protein
MSRDEPRDWTPGVVAALMDNPFYAINIDPELAMPHDPILEEEAWIAANVNRIPPTPSAASGTRQAAG